MEEGRKEDDMTQENGKGGGGEDEEDSRLRIIESIERKRRGKIPRGNGLGGDRGRHRRDIRRKRIKKNRTMVFLIILFLLFVFQSSYFFSIFSLTFLLFLPWFSSSGKKYFIT